MHNIYDYYKHACTYFLFLFIFILFCLYIFFFFFIISHIMSINFPVYLFLLCISLSFVPINLKWGRILNFPYINLHKFVKLKGTIKILTMIYWSLSPWSILSFESPVAYKHLNGWYLHSRATWCPLNFMERKMKHSRLIYMTIW